LNCFITFNTNSFVIEERGIGRLIGEGHEFGGLYYLGTRQSISCIASPFPKFFHDCVDHPQKDDI